MEKKIAPEKILAPSPNGIIVVNHAGYIAFINFHAAKFLKPCGKNILGADVSKISHYFKELIIRSLKIRAPIKDVHLTIKNENFETDIAPIYENDSPIGVVCSLRKKNDIAKYKSELKSHHFLQLQFNTLLDFSSYGIWILDGKGTVLRVNSAAERLIGIRSKDVVGKNIMQLVEKEVIDEALTPYILASKRPVRKLLYVLKTKKYIMSSGTPVLDKDGNIILLVVTEHDMTTLNKLQMQLDEMRVMTEKYKDELSDLNLLELKTNDIVAKSKEMRQVLRVALKLARLTVSNILILGESGVGKGLIAKFIHENSKRKNKPFIQINCAALPEGLLEAELFGFEKGAFTGAHAHGKIGLFEMAQGGTILLDEIGEIPLLVQAKLLRCLDEHEIMHLGGLKPIKIDCTMIAATNRNLKVLVQENKFREDLYHRLNTFNIQIPPLRQRPEDIVNLLTYYLKKYNEEYVMEKRLSHKAIRQIQSHQFTGNVRELKNMVKNAVVLADTDRIDEFITDASKVGEIHKPSISRQNVGLSLRLEEQLSSFEREILEHALLHCKSTRQMAQYLKTSQSKVVRMLKKHNLSIKPL